jgi:hypothetical protein
VIPLSPSSFRARLLALIASRCHGMTIVVIASSLSSLL